MRENLPKVFKIIPFPNEILNLKTLFEYIEVQGLVFFLTDKVLS